MSKKVGTNGMSLSRRLVLVSFFVLALVLAIGFTLRSVYLAPDYTGHYMREDVYPGIKRLPLEYVTTRSGERMAVRVAVPADNDGEAIAGQFPVILVQSAYNVGLVYDFDGLVEIGMPDPFFIKKGYIVVSVDTLGGGISEGGWEMLGRAEQNAMADAVDWVTEQTWYDGNMGAVGASYMAITALFAAQQRPDDIKAVFASVPIGDAGRGIASTGGLINALFLRTWAVMTHATSVVNQFNKFSHPEHADIIEAATAQHIDQIENHHFPVLKKALEGHEALAYDGEFWRTRSTMYGMDKIKAPVFITGALHDIFQRDAPLLFKAVSQNPKSRLAIFEGNHISHFEPAMKGTEATAPLKGMELQWLDEYLKGIDTGIEKMPRVTQFVKHYKEGSSAGFDMADSWPHPKATPERWFLQEAGTLQQTAPIELDASKTMNAAEAIDIDFSAVLSGQFINSHLTIKDDSDCSMSFVQWTLGGSALLPKDCYSDHTFVERAALNYESEAMTEDYYINGPIQADIWISSTVTNAIISVRIDEVEAEAGKVNPLSNGLLVASARSVDESRSIFIKDEMLMPYHFFTKEEEQLLEPGKPVLMQIEVFPTSALIRKGNRLRVSIAPSNQAQGVMNHVQREQMKGGVTTVLNSQQYPSSVVLPIVPVSELD